MAVLGFQVFLQNSELRYIVELLFHFLAVVLYFSSHAVVCARFFFISSLHTCAFTFLSAAQEISVKRKKTWNLVASWDKVKMVVLMFYVIHSSWDFLPTKLGISEFPTFL